MKSARLSKRLLGEIRFRLGAFRQARNLHEQASAARSMYLDLMQRSLSGELCGVEASGKRGSGKQVRKLVRRGRGPLPYTMLGKRRLDNLRWCVEDVLRRGVPGDLIETGVWRGGATILMRAILQTYGDTTRRVWVADSFKGLPPPDEEKHPADAGDPHHTIQELAVSLEQVKANFEHFGLLDRQVRFLEGWFEDTLPVAPIDRLALVRLDGDMYGSTMDGLVNLYPKLSTGGYLIVDDYGAVQGCKQAVEDYRREHGISEKIQKIDWTGVYWQKTS